MNSIMEDIRHITDGLERPRAQTAEAAFLTRLCERVDNARDMSATHEGWSSTGYTMRAVDLVTGATYRVTVQRVEG